jgi:energy-coupling factor transporter ATP-binding protein EcfA2
MMGAICSNLQPLPCLSYSLHSIKKGVSNWLGYVVSLEIPQKLADFSARIWFVFLMNLHHLIPVGVAGAACFIPALVPGGIPLSAALISSVGALATAFSYFSYQLMNSWGLYPYDFLEKMEPVLHFIERPKVIERLSDYLSKSEENNVLLVGKPGTGKTTLAKALAQTIEEKRPEALKGYEVLYLNLDRLQAVNQPFGQFESRFLEIIKVLQGRKIVLVIDEAHRLLLSGSGSPLSDRLKTYSSLRILGITTLDDYRKYFAADLSFNERFTKVKLQEMDEETTQRVLKKKFPSIADEVLKYIVEQSKILHPEQAQPRSAVKLAINVVHRYPKCEVTKKMVNKTVIFEKESLDDL